VCRERYGNINLNLKIQGAFGYFSRCWEKYLAAAQWHNNKRLPQGGETITKIFLVKYLYKYCLSNAHEHNKETPAPK
jgi:hypothetical protein